MTKHEVNMLVTKVCGISVVLIAAAATLAHFFGPQVGGCALVGAAVILWRIGGKAGRAARQNEKRPPIGPTAEEVARREQAWRIAGSARREFDRSLNEFERRKKVRG